MKAVEQYLERYAEPEARLADQVCTRYDHVVVVPVRRESPEFVRGIGRARGRALCIAVVNDEVADASAAASVPSRCSPDMDVLVVDRASPGNTFDAGQGVGLARKIGCDVALALHRAGTVRSSWIRTTDADAQLPAEYFEADHSGAAALAYPFWHAPSGDPIADTAVAVYELWLRYYVAGLRFAGSPYATHTLGSCLAFRAGAYAAVRGVPRRAAGEDFYLAAKLAKFGPIARPDCPPVVLASRLSDRVPFGTGPGARRIAEQLRAGEQPRFYDPRVFDGLKRIVAGIDGGEVLHPDLREGILAATRSATTRPQWVRRAHEWFDALRTLKFIHAQRDAAFESVPWREAIARAPFVAADPDVDTLRRALASDEARA